MKSEQIFLIGRFWKLLRRDFYLLYRSVLLGGGAAAGIFLFIVLVSSLTAPGSLETEFNQSFFGALLLIGGYLVSAAIFNNIHQSPQNYFEFIIPASLPEKIISKLLISAFIFTVITVVGFWFLTLIANLLTMLLTPFNFPLFSPFAKQTLHIIVIYLVTQSIFLFGGIYFKKHPFLKTVLFSFLLVIILSAAAGLFGYLLFRNFAPDFHPAVQLSLTDNSALVATMQTWGKIAEYAFWILFAPYFWILSYIRLRETEVF